jgi:hypothetical protein
MPAIFDHEISGCRPFTSPGKRQLASDMISTLTSISQRLRMLACISLRMHALASTISMRVDFGDVVAIRTLAAPRFRRYSGCNPDSVQR